MFEERYKNRTHIEQIPEWHTEESPWKVKHIMRLLERWKLVPGMVCEVGCGFGEVLRLLQERLAENCEFWGYEISPVALEHAQERANQRLHFKLADITQEAMTFDLMLVLDVVEHAENYLGLLQQIRTKSEYKIFQIPLDLSAQTVLRGKVLLRLREELGHIHYFTKDTALQTLVDCGYEILDYAYTSSSLELPTHLFITRLMRGPRRICYALNRDLAVRMLGGYRLMVLAR